MRTPLTADYGLDAPIVAAGMAFVSLPELVAAVGNAGGMGVLGVGVTPPEGLRSLVREVRERSDRTFGVDFITEFATDEHLAVCIEERVPVVVFFWGDPGDRVALLQEEGVRVWMQVGSSAEARLAVERGVDLVVAQGAEAGGHNRGAAGTVVLTPAVVDAADGTPVLAAGGIVDGRGLAAALALGAAGVWVGTRFLASKEAYAHPEYKRRVVDASEADTVRTTMFGPEWPDQQTRVLRNRVVGEWAGREGDLATAPAATIGETSIDGARVPMPKFSALLPTPDTGGDLEEMCLLAGEGAGLVREVRPAAEIVAGMAAEAEAILSRRATSAGHVEPASIR